MTIDLIRENTPAKGRDNLPSLYPIRNFTVVESIWGKFIICRNSAYHPEVMIKTGQTVHPAENEALACIIETLPENCVIIDAGANVGAFCVPMSIAARPKKGTVYAFEVQKKLYQALCGTIVLNDFDNLEIYNVGLGEEEKELRVPKVDYNQYQDYGIVSLIDQERIQKSENEIIEIVTVDQLGFQRLDLFKIDVEGMELEILKGSVATVKKHRPYFWIEFYNSNTKLLREWFDELGNYTVYQVTGADILCVPDEKIIESNLKINCPLFSK